MLEEGRMKHVIKPLVGDFEAFSSHTTGIRREWTGCLDMVRDLMFTLFI